MSAARKKPKTSAKKVKVRDLKAKGSSKIKGGMQKQELMGATAKPNP